MFPRALESCGYEPHWSSKPGVWGVHLPDVVLDASSNPFFLGRSSGVLSSLLPGDLHAKSGVYGKIVS